MIKSKQKSYAKKAFYPFNETRKTNICFHILYNIISRHTSFKPKTDFRRDTEIFLDTENIYMRI
jgi:hypothetical protein